MLLALALAGRHWSRQGDRGLVLQVGETWFAEGALVVVIVRGFLDPPESSYAITWPLLFSLIAVGYWFYFMSKDGDTYSMVRVFLLLAAAIVAIVLFVPNVQMTFAGSDTNGLFRSMVTLVLMLGLLRSLAPHHEAEEVVAGSGGRRSGCCWTGSRVGCLNPGVFGLVERGHLCALA